ncbi:MAG TPA: tRNA (adenosine(37)-N6)-threonylcarbamoyltransferase complex ATPase subunit type 1 TsaE [Firmicutes bacterium]|nr:tRNA (adenosine(37)-N6)-threonylcarbamoyltransferase complex ATPase subunit type 1 TsaE [Bacillota bacterium]
MNLAGSGRLAAVFQLTTKSVEETEKIGHKLGELAEPGMLILLTGDLGAGKTAFARGVGRGLGVKGPVTSPSFTLVEEHHGRIPLYHMDVYRLHSPEELIDIGYEEYVDSEGICLIEWGDLVREMLSAEHLEIKISGVGAERTITFLPYGAYYKRLVEELTTSVASSSGDGNTHA